MLYVALDYDYDGRTGSTGFKGLRGDSGLVEWIGGLLFAIAVAFCVAGPTLQLADALNSIEALNVDIANILGVVLTSLGIVITAVAQFAMGDAWALMRSAIDYLVTIGTAEALLWVLASNASARRFYELAGWAWDGRAKTTRLADLPDVCGEVEEVCYRHRLLPTAALV